MLNRLPKLLALNKSIKREFRASAPENGEATIYIYDIIGEDFWTGEGVTAKKFLDAIEPLRGVVNTIHVRINSPGGDVFDARAITSLMLSFPAKFVAHIDGLAASAASYISSRCDSCEISPGAWMMIHNAWSMAMGDKNEFRSVANLLDKIDISIAADYVEKTGKGIDEIIAWMNAETWFTAAEAIDAKLCDTLAEKAAVKNLAWNLSAYDKPPQNLIDSLTDLPEIISDDLTATVKNEQDLKDQKTAYESRLRDLRLAEIEIA